MYIKPFIITILLINGISVLAMDNISNSTISLNGIYEKKDNSEIISEGPWEISEIIVKGNINLKTKTIIKTVRAKKNKLYYEEDKKVDIENLMALGGIDRVSISLEYDKEKEISPKNKDILKDIYPVKITYSILEKPMIKEIKFSGNKELSKGAIKGEMTVGEKDFFDELKIKEDIIKIIDKYHEKGYIDANADYEVETDTKTNKAILNIKISEGKKAKIENIEINVRAFKTKKILKLMKNRAKKIYKPKEFDNDLKEIEKYYKTNGYNDFKIIDSTITFNEDRSKVYIKINISEGSKYIFGDTTFEGNNEYSSKDLIELIEYSKGKTYNEEKLNDSIKNIQEKYADKGYLKAVIEPIKNAGKKAQALDINFKITENTQIYVDHIDIEGNKATKTHVFRREIVQKEGEVFSLSKIRRSQEKIFNLGFIDDVNPVINPTQDPDKVDIVFDITEGKPGMLTAGAGLSSRDGLVGTLSVSHMNLFGLAQRLALTWNFGKRVQDYSISWTTPWIKDHPTSLGVDLYNTRRFKPYSTSYSAYTERRNGGRITLGPRFENDKYHLTLSYSYEKVKITDVENIYKGILQEGTSVNSSISVEFARDTRDYIWDPTKGSRSSIGIELTGGPLGGDVNFYKPTISHSYNKKLFSIDDYPFVFSIASRFGYVKSFGETKSVPVYERFFLGGADTIRGYNSNGQIGPENGGKVYGVANMEFKFPLAREKKRTIVQWAFFIDAGNSWNHFDDINFKIGSRTRQIKTGAGFGIRFTTPAFPIRLDWGYGFNHKSGEQLSDIYFTIGNLF